MYVLLTFYVLFVHLCSVVSCFWSYVCTTDFLRSFCASVFRRFVKTFAGSLDLNLQFSACLSVSFRSGVLRVFLCWKLLYKLSARGNRGKTMFIAYLYFDRAVCKLWSHWQVLHVFDGESWSCSETSDCLPYTMALNILDCNVRNTLFFAHHGLRE